MKLRLSSLCTAQTVLLIALVALFYKELYVLGIGLYQGVTDSPKATLYLGKYYETASNNNKDLSDVLYGKTLKSLKTQLATASPEEQPYIDLEIAKLYQCGRGVKLDMLQAEEWFEKALKASKEKSFPEFLEKRKSAPCN